MDNAQKTELYNLALSIDSIGTNRYTEGYESGLPGIVRSFIPTGYDELDAIIARHKPVITYGLPGLDSPRYGTMKDQIDMLVPPAFESRLSYAIAVMHEVIHWTMKPGRAGRKAETRGDEEMVAEIGAGMLMAHVGEWESVREDVAGYVHGWMMPDYSDADRFIAMLLGEPLPAPSFPTTEEFTKRFNLAVRRATRAVNFLLKG